MGYIILFFLNLLAPLIGGGVVLAFLFSSRRNLLKNLRGELGQRFVFAPKHQVYGNYIWLHAASVGEVKACAKIAAEFKEYYNKPILLTASTAAGRAAAEREPVFDTAVLMPVDFYPFIKKFIKIYKPQRLFIIEADLWPNMIVACGNNNVPVGIINGRLSARSAGRYALLKPLVKLVFSKITFICAQTPAIMGRYIALGAAADKVYMCGNIKYDLLNTEPARQTEAAAIIKQLGWAGAPVITCGSTHEEEERVILSASAKLKDACFIIAPRHLERKKYITQMLDSSGIKYAVLSKIKPGEVFKEQPQILLADAMGWLGAFYKAAQIAFVGGSITKRGGHNFLEAAALSKPVLFGQYYYNAPDVAQKLLESRGGFLVSQNNFADTLDLLIRQSAALQSAASAAGQTAEFFRGATAKTLDVVKKYERN